ncbi:fumarate hydratase [Candidatus Wirthbacteria bacterium CG2_30_54_11]|uniref:Fumarate hydratase n=1 Tax=Candidatus Wirthbacteria bacterium CG2_30_54_11 TaxID=1817892 RepID=A0A1J5IUK4_9BACT|nr:MAG: fumarate hydratase [Candidatus Wirthbacteria bacterium CG2_30_54_11]
MTEPIKISTPLTDASVRSLKAGDNVLITGTIYAGRDIVHQRLVELLQQGKPLPFDICGQIIYYVGPAPARPGQVIGPAGPTTSYRMDGYTPQLVERGLKGMIGKGNRSQAVVDAIVKNQAVYFAAIGGAAALIARTIQKAEVIAWPELGPEALQRLEVVDMPVIVINDSNGNDLYAEGQKHYAR